MLLPLHLVIRQLALCRLRNLLLRLLRLLLRLNSASAGSLREQWDRRALLIVIATARGLDRNLSLSLLVVLLRDLLRLLLGNTAIGNGNHAGRGRSLLRVDGDGLLWVRGVRGGLGLGLGLLGWDTAGRNSNTADYGHGEGLGLAGHAVEAGGAVLVELDGVDGEGNDVQSAGWQVRILRGKGEGKGKGTHN